MTAKTKDDKTAFDNPIGTKGFGFIEFTAQDKATMTSSFEKLNFVAVGRHKVKDITLYQQGNILILLNFEPDTFASEFEKIHGPCCPSMSFLVEDSTHAYNEALKRGAKPYKGESVIPHLKAIYGIGESLLYFIDSNDLQMGAIPFSSDFEAIKGAKPLSPTEGLGLIDHLTHNVVAGRMDVWADFYERIFNFREIRFFDIDGKQTGLTSRALCSPCDTIRIPLNQSKDDKSQIVEYLRQYNGEGIQHIAFKCQDIYSKVETLRENAVPFLKVPNTYYEAVNNRVPDHGEDLVRMQKNQILIDGSKKEHDGLLLQLFTENLVGPIFFEIIERKGNEGFGEGNFKALFQAMEDDQVRRGVLDKIN